MVNKYKGTCVTCGTTVKANAGYLEKSGRQWVVKHLACLKQARVDKITFSSGASFTRNSNGRCEDAPCCGCCTI